MAEHILHDVTTSEHFIGPMYYNIKARNLQCLTDCRENTIELRFEWHCHEAMPGLHLRRILEEVHRMHSVHRSCFQRPNAGVSAAAAHRGTPPTAANDVRPVMYYCEALAW